MKHVHRSCARQSTVILGCAGPRTPLTPFRAHAGLQARMPYVLQGILHRYHLKSRGTKWIVGTGADLSDITRHNGRYLAGACEGRKRLAARAQETGCGPRTSKDGAAWSYLKAGDAPAEENDEPVAVS